MYPKAALFRKSKVYRICSAHNHVKLLSEKGIKKQVPYQLIHDQGFDNLSWQVFKKKWRSWSNLQAKQLARPFSEIPKWNYSKQKWDMPTKLRLKHPVFIGMFASLGFHWLNGLKQAIKNKSFYPVRYGFFTGLYYFLTYYTYLKISKNV